MSALNHLKPLLVQLHRHLLGAYASLAALSPGSLEHVHQQISLQQRCTWYAMSRAFLWSSIVGAMFCVYVYEVAILSFSGPRVFMSCPVELPATEVETWFINLWNHFVIPYLMGTIMAGIEVCVPLSVPPFCSYM